MVAAMLTKPELSSLTELQFLAGNLSPAILALSLVKTALFAALVLGITLAQGRRAQRLHMAPTAALSRAISLSIAVVLGIDLIWVLLLDPNISGGGI
jgi:hypothetical protein